MAANTMDEHRLVQLVDNAGIPLTAKKVALAALGSAGARDVAAVEESLNRLQQAGKLHAFPPEQRGWAQRFYSVSPLEWVQDRILKRVEAGSGRVTQKQVKALLYKWEHKYCDEAVGGLIKEGKLHYLALRSKFLVLSPPTPFDYLLDRQVTALKEIVERINRRRSRPLTVDELRSFLDGDSAASSEQSSIPGRLTEDILRAWYDEDVPLRGGVTSVPIPWTWNHYVHWCKENGFQPELDRFQGLLKSLYEAGTIELIPHSHAHEIPSEEARVALSAPSGEVLYYWRWR